MGSEQPQLTSEELTQLVGHMTAGDFWRFTEQRGNEQARSLFAALYRAAQRQGMVNGEAMDVFLDRVEIGALLGLVQGRSPLAAVTGEPLPDSADTGE